MIGSPLKLQGVCGFAGTVRINVNQRFALKDAADAHKALEARATSGSTVLIIEPTVHRSLP